MSKRKFRKRHPLNDPAKWDEDISPPYFDRASYQARIDARVGKNRDGKSIIRLVWGPEVIGLYGVPRYWLRRSKDGEGHRYATIKRWYLEKRIEREQYVDSWNAARLGTPAEVEETCEACGSKAKPIEVFGKTLCSQCGSDQMVKGQVTDRGVPPDEFYVFAWMCAEHRGWDQDAGWPKCCEVADRDNHRRCFGEFRSPNDYDLNCISAAVQRREGEPYANPYAPLSAHDLAAIEMSSGLQTERMMNAIQQKQVDILGQKDQHWRLWETDPTVLKHGRHHFQGANHVPTERRTPAGIILPD